MLYPTGDALAELLYLAPDPGKAPFRIGKASVHPFDDPARPISVALFAVEKGARCDVDEAAETFHRRRHIDSEIA